jgi:hypothetical protein
VIDIACPALQEHGLTLDLVASFRGLHEAPRTPSLTGRIALGGPFAVPVTPEYVAGDADLRAFVEQESAHSTFHLVHMSVSFAAEPSAPQLETTTLYLRLGCAAGLREPVAWSMTPLRAADATQVERRVKLGPQLKLIDAEFEQTVSRQRDEIFLQAQRELRSDPAWEFRRTKNSPLYGSHRLIMVVRAAKGQPTSISAAVSATARGNLLRRYAREFQDVLSLEVV